MRRNSTSTPNCLSIYLRLPLASEGKNKTLTFIDRNEKNNQYLSSSLKHAYNLSMDDFFLC